METYLLQPIYIGLLGRDTRLGGALLSGARNLDAERGDFGENIPNSSQGPMPERQRIPTFHL